MGAGARNRRITFQTKTTTTDALGGEVVTWVDGYSVWAKVTPVSDGEKWRAGQVERREIAWFRCRASSETDAITTEARILLDGAAWSISGKKEADDRRLVEFTAEKTDF